MVKGSLYCRLHHTANLSVAATLDIHVAFPPTQCGLQSAGLLLSEVRQKDSTEVVEIIAA